MIDLQAVEWAVREGRRYVPWLRVAGNLRSGDPDELHTHAKAGPGWVLPATWVAAEEITRLIADLNRWVELEDALHDETGWLLCNQLVREVRGAVRRWPLEEKPHRVRNVRCPNCGALTLRYLPPVVTGGRVLDPAVRCTDCDHRMDETEFSALSELVVAEHLARADAVKQGRLAPAE